MLAIMSNVASVGMVGLGVMGAPMAENLMKAKPEVRVLVHGRSRDRLQSLLDAGAEWAETPAEIGACDVIISVLPDLPELEKLVEQGLLDDADGHVLVVSSTSSPDGCRELAERVAEHGVSFADAPISGGEDGAKAATLSIFVGASDEVFDRIKPVLDAMGNPVLLGPIGAGQVAKACNQLIVSTTVLALGEVAVIADRAGLDVGALFDTLAGGYAGSRILETRGPRMVKRDYSPSGVARYMNKDLSFAAAEVERGGVHPVVLPLVREAFLELTDAGFGDDDIAVTRKFIEERD